MVCKASSVLVAARTQLGYVESPGNHTKYGRWYGMDGEPWCAMFLSWCFYKAGGSDIGGKFARTDAWAKWFHDKHEFSAVPTVGAVAFFNFGKSDGWDGRWLGIHHVGIVEAVLSGGYVITIEGNTSGTNNANGGEVRRQKRHISNIAGFGHPAYVREGTKFPLGDGKVFGRDLTHKKPEIVSGHESHWAEDKVRLIQKRINVKVTGKYGWRTARAVAKYQRAKLPNIVRKGFVGPKTWKRLGL